MNIAERIAADMATWMASLSRQRAEAAIEYGDQRSLALRQAERLARQAGPIAVRSHDPDDSASWAGHKFLFADGSGGSTGSDGFRISPYDRPEEAFAPKDYL